MRPAEHAGWRRETGFHFQAVHKTRAPRLSCQENGFTRALPLVHCENDKTQKVNSKHEACPRGGKGRGVAGAGLQVRGRGDERDTVHPVRGPLVQGLRVRPLKSNSQVAITLLLGDPSCQPQSGMFLHSSHRRHAPPDVP